MKEALYFIQFKVNAAFRYFRPHHATLRLGTFFSTKHILLHIVLLCAVDLIRLHVVLNDIFRPLYGIDYTSRFVDKTDLIQQTKFFVKSQDCTFMIWYNRKMHRILLVRACL